ncbi:MAG: nuclear transport factor 2 family protein [Alphaproteobacteria bacterium]
MARAETPSDVDRLLFEAYNRGDLDGMVALYHQNCRVVTPDGVKEGTAAARAFLGGLVDLKGKVSWTEAYAVAAGDTGMVSSRWSVAFKGPDGSNQTLAGTSVVVVTKGADGWKYLIDHPFGGGVG